MCHKTRTMASTNLRNHQSDEHKDGDGDHIDPLQPRLRQQLSREEANWMSLQNRVKQLEQQILQIHRQRQVDDGPELVEKEKPMGELLVLKDDERSSGSGISSKQASNDVHPAIGGLNMSLQSIVRGLSNISNIATGMHDKQEW